MISLGLPLLITLDVVADFEDSLSGRDIGLMYGATGVLGATVGYSRLFLGVHGLD